MECNKRCLTFDTDEQVDISRKYKLTFGEMLCVERCFGKFTNVKEVVDFKLKEQVEK